MVDTVKDMDGVTFHDLYENYPDFFIDIPREQKLLLQHDIIVWHHPFYWYSAPALLKEWMDLVLEHGFAYGAKGHALDDKKVLSVISTGGQKAVYSVEGRNRYTINQFLVPFRQSANLCRMDYLPPFVVHGSHTINRLKIEEYARKYRRALEMLRDNSLKKERFSNTEYLNDLID
jgi:glutathione-regulated potassium-efflux system ancillary protein KefG